MSSATASKPQGRTGVPHTVYLDPQLDAAVREFIESQDLRPSKTSVFETALREFLKSRGCWPRKKNGGA